MDATLSKVEKILVSISNTVNPLFVLGGFVRDFLLKRKTAEFDLDCATPLSIERLKELLPASFFASSKEQTLNVIRENIQVEITPFRGPTLQDDLENRDLTINSIAFPVEQGKLLLDSAVDPTGGREDLHFGVLRCWSEKNLLDDPLRMLRVFRFQAQLGFEIEAQTWGWIGKNRHRISSTSLERVVKEMDLLLQGEFATMALRSCTASGLLQTLFPEFSSLADFRHDDKHHHGETVLEHSFRVVQNCPKDPTFRWAALLHDMGKPAAFDPVTRRYIDHDRLGLPLQEKLLLRLPLSQERIRKILFLCEHHMFPIESLRKARLMVLHHGFARFQELMAFFLADKCATHPFDNSDFRSTYDSLVETVSSEAHTLAQIQAQVRGQLLLDMGIPRGPWYSQILQKTSEHFATQPKRFSPAALRRFLETEFLFSGSYPSFHFRDLQAQRVEEYVYGTSILGRLDPPVDFSAQRRVFSFRYVSDPGALQKALDEHPFIPFFSAKK